MINQSTQINRVVVRGTNWVGDALMSVPALRELRRVLPHAHITLCTRSWAKGIFADAEFLDDILLFDKQNSTFGSTLKQANEWRAQKFDLAILLNNAFESAFLAFAGRAEKRIGYNTEKRGFLLTDALAVPAWKNERHEVFYYLNIIAELERRLTGKTEVWERAPNINLTVSIARQIAARELLQANGADLTNKTVALCPGSTNSRAKRWHAESYAKLTDLISENLNANVILIGASDEIEVSKQILSLTESTPILLVGKTSLAESAAVLSVADLLVTNDTGPAHIAPAVGTKTIVIFGPTVPATTRPFSDLAQIVSNPPACAPCMLRDCPIDHRCMTAVTPEEVFRLIEN